MRLEVKKRGTREFYNEMLYVVTYFKKFIKNPKRKAWQYTHFLMMYWCISLVMLLAFVFLYLSDKEWYSLVFIGIFSLMLLFLGAFYIAVNKRIKSYMDDLSDKTIEIENDYISLNSDAINVKMIKDKISIIVINKHSICVLPKEAGQYSISISTEFLDEFLKGASENGFNNLIVNNIKS